MWKKKAKKPAKSVVVVAKQQVKLPTPLPKGAAVVVQVVVPSEWRTEAQREARRRYEDDVRAGRAKLV